VLNLARNIDLNVTLPGGFVVDAVCGGVVIEILKEPKELARVRGSIFAFADAIGHVAEMGGSGFDGFVILMESPQLSTHVVDELALSMNRTLRPEISDRLRLWICQKGVVEGRGLDDGSLSDREAEIAEAVLERVGERRMSRGPVGGDATFEIQKLAVLQWMQDGGAMTPGWITHHSGYSYPTVSKALKSLEESGRDVLTRHSGRKGVELSRFPLGAWAWILSRANESRETIRFVSEGDPRPPKALLDRLRRANFSHVAVGGVDGARRLLPSLDLFGQPRLDLTVHARGMRSRDEQREEVAEIVSRLDPALMPVQSAGQAASLVVHFLYRKTAFFEEESGLQWADSAECLLDLHELGMESQAEQFLKSHPMATR